jgi:BolA protein
MTYAERMQAKLTDGLAPERLEIRDVSHRHAGHSGAHPDGETHFDVLIVSARFAGMGRVARQRLVFDLLRSELEERVHALSLRTLTPGEFGSS